MLLVASCLKHSEEKNYSMEFSLLYSRDGPSRSPGSRTQHLLLRTRVCFTQLNNNVVVDYINFIQLQMVVVVSRQSHFPANGKNEMSGGVG